MARIAFVTTSYPSYPGDPAGHFVELEATQRAKTGDSVVVFAPGARRSTLTGIRFEPLPGDSAFGWPGALTRLGERPYRALPAGAFIVAARRSILRAGPFDSIVAHWLIPSAFPIACAGVGPLEVVVHGSDARLLLRLPRSMRTRIVNHLLSRGARFRFVSNALRHELAARTSPMVLERSKVAPSLIDVDGVPTRAEARAKLGIGAAERLAVVVGRLVDEKRPAEAVAIALGRCADRVVVVGDGPLRAQVARLDARVATIGLAPRSDTLAWIAAADLLVSASLDEGAPTAIREARALGVPVVARPCGDLATWAALDSGIELVTL